MSPTGDPCPACLALPCHCGDITRDRLYAPLGPSRLHPDDIERIATRVVEKLREQKEQA